MQRGQTVSKILEEPKDEGVALIFVAEPVLGGQSGRLGTNVDDAAALPEADAGEGNYWAQEVDAGETVAEEAHKNV